MYALNNIVACSRNNCYHERATMRSLCTVETQVAVNNTKVLTAARHSSATQVCHHQQHKVLTPSRKVPDIFVRVESNLRFSRQAFVEVPVFKFHENRCSGSRADTCRQTQGGDNSPLHDYANALNFLAPGLLFF